MPSHDPLDDSEDWDDPSWDDLHDWDHLDEGDSADAFTPPPHPDDRIWRHPAEVAAELRAAEAARQPAPEPSPVGPVEAMALDPRLTTATDRSIGGRNTIFALATTAVVGLLVLGGLQLSNQNTTDENATGTTASVVTTSTSESGQDPAWPDTLQSRVEPGLPAIEVVIGGEMILGGGIVIDESGHVMTSAQLVRGASHIIVRDNENRYEANLVGSDVLTDVAVIHIEGLPRPPAALGINEMLQAGQYALSTEEGELNVGQITKINDELELDSGVRVYGLIETTLPSEEAQPGTAIFDDRGLIIGMTPWNDASDIQGHAVPIRLADRVARQIISTGTASHAWLGIQGTDAAIPDCTNPDHDHGGGSKSSISIRNVPAEQVAGLASQAAAVMVVQDRGPAEAAGLIEGDLIIALAGSPIHSMADLVSTLRQLAPGDEVSLTYLRDDVFVDTLLELGEVTD